MLFFGAILKVYFDDEAIGNCKDFKTALVNAKKLFRKN